MSKGWIKLHRSIQDCWIWLDDKPFSKGQAWVDILLSCNHADKKIPFDGKPIVVKRGEWITSVVSLAERWGWGRKKVSNFLNVLEEDLMIEQQRNNKRTLIKVVNYDVYQVLSECEEHQTNTKGTTEEHQRNTNKNDKECKEVNIYMSFPLKDGTEYDIDEDFVKQMKELYPKVDVDQEFLAMKGWLVGNPTKRKTKKGMPRFITGWLGRDKKSAPDTKPTTKFNNFTERTIDFEDLEKMI